ncbi:MAG: VCBS repeat-containing protein [Geobacter sp.]|nr:VCBS repeat-containing protein [Geobacter sp.]
METRRWMRWLVNCYLAMLLVLTTAFSASALTWSTRPSLPTGTSRASGVVVYGRLYLLGGATASGISNSVFVYDPAAPVDPVNGAWGQMSPLSEPRFAAAEATIGDIIYLVGGGGSPTSETSVLAYSISAGTTSIAGSLVVPRFRASAAAFNNRIYVVGGSNGSVLDTIEAFDPSTGSSYIKATLPAPRELASAVLLNGKIYIIGGTDAAGTPTATCWEYDPVTDSLTERAPMPIAATAKSAVTANGKIYIVGGMTSVGYPPSAWDNAIQEYDPATNTWRTLDPYPTTRYASAAGVIDGTLYVVGGDDGNPDYMTRDLAVNEAALLTASSPGDGTVWAWGNNGIGQLGDGTNIDKALPVQVVGLDNVQAIAGAMLYSLALKPDGTVWSWGSNDDGGLGDGTYNSRNMPGLVSGLSDVKAIAAGWFHSLALQNDGTVWRWGKYSGGIGISPPSPDLIGIDSNVPVQVDGLNNVLAVVGGGNHSIALKADGTVWTWGLNSQGQLGDGTTTNSTIPVQVPGLDGVIAIAAGVEHTAVLKADGTVWTWGKNDYGQLGDGTNFNRSAPAPVPGLDNVTAIFGGGWHTIALKADGTVWTWGWNIEGQLGDGTNIDRNIPVQVPGLSGVVAIDGECVSSIALKSNGTVWEWGSYYRDGTSIINIAPVQLPGIDSVTAIAAGMDFRMAIVGGGGWTINSVGPPYAQPTEPKYVIDWPSSQHEPLMGEAYVRIAGVYYYVYGSASGSWSGPDYNAAALQQCDQITGQPLFDANYNPLFPDMRGKEGMAIYSYISWPGSSDTIPPVVISTSPSQGEGNVSPTTAVTVNFNESIDPLTVGSSTFYVTGPNGTVTGSWSVSGNSVTFVPSVPFSTNITYSATIAGVKDLSGNELSSSYSWSFTTIEQFDVSGTVVGNGTISCISPVLLGGSSVCTVVSNAGNRLLSLIDNGVDVTSGLIGSSFTIQNVTSNHAVVATFAAEYTISATAVGNGSISCSSPVLSGNNSTCTITPNYGYHLLSLTDNTLDVSSSVSANKYTMTNVTLNHVLTATFVPNIYSLVVNKTGLGSITSNPAGIDLASGAQATASFDYGTLVTLAATPDSSSFFTGWSGACSGTAPCNVLIGGNKTVSGSFMQKAIFDAASNYGSWSYTSAVASGDLNGDGKPDLTFTNQGRSSVGVVTLLNNGDGTYRTGGSFGVGWEPVSIAIADFNGDGKADLATANSGSDSVTLLLGNGDGTFKPAVPYSTGTGTYPISLAVDDFNHDGVVDLAVVDSRSSDVGNIAVMLGNGDGTLLSPVYYVEGRYPIHITKGDFNGDGNTDLAVLNDGGGISVFLGNGDGTFTVKGRYDDGGWAPASTTAGDVNGDGKIDLVVANSYNDYVSILNGNGDGSFAAPVNFAVGDAPASVVVGDFNGDGKADVVSANRGSSNVSVLLGNGNGTFQSATIFGTGAQPVRLIADDVNNDGKIDLVTANYNYYQNSVSVLLNNSVFLKCAVPSWAYVATANSAGTFGVSWGASSTSGASYVLEESTDASFATSTQVYSGSGTFVNLTGRTNGTYYYRVKAIAAGYSDSAWVSPPNGCAVSLPCKTPSWVYVATANSTGTFGVSWGASATAGANYILEESRDDAGFANPGQVYSGSGTFVNLTGRANGTYYYRVKAIAPGYSDSAWQSPANGCTVSLPCKAPAWAYVATANSTGTFGVSWGASSTSGASYVLEESTDASFATSTQVYSGSGTFVNLTGRVNGTYYYRVKATAPGYSDSAWVSPPNGCMVSLPCNAPAWVYVATANSTGTFGVSWGASATAGASYILEESRDDAGFANPVQVYSGSGTFVNGHKRMPSVKIIKCGLNAHP